MGLVCDIHSRMAQMPPLFEKYQNLDESKLVDPLANKSAKNPQGMLISQGFNPETGDMEIFIEHYKRTRPWTTSTWLSFMPQTITKTQRERKSVPNSSNGRKTVRNFIRKNPHFIALSMVKIKVTPLGSAKSSRQGLKIKTILNMQLSIKRGSSNK